MKIKINDLEHILKQIQNIEKPTTKEHSKVLNTLKIFLEDNTDVQDPAILKIKQEFLISKFYNLSKTRRVEPKEHKEDFKKFIEKLKEEMANKNEKEEERVGEIDLNEVSDSILDYNDLFKDFKKVNEESQKVSERIDLITSGLSLKEIKNNDNTKTIINYFKTL
ncbi:hypothetical protein NBO_7g0033 [Nosema bombycis CQ1]|uniref:Uncharacterized protein n=1 Tax=Nosema bombycis (strain CQ1 / CVCC 102059) TaxID=578461 RepID=R0MLT9_NOSB1|nr:hypothetical protein NBO_7g0033 [Nosema bombycis CQ1]|eukprot:EOB15215.1 hypothetical protein NBO_7g0033 [Nosema bombycis CQ1]